MLSQSGYEVEERNCGHPQQGERHWSEVRSLGFDMLPLVVIADRAFLGFPDEHLRRELGLPAAPDGAGVARERVESTLGSLELFARLVPHIPDRYWELKLVEERDRPLGQWVWHVFELAVEVMEALRERSLPGERVLELAERRRWRSEDRFRSFDRIATYGLDVIQRLRRWRDVELPEGLGVPIDSDWGEITILHLLDHLDRHSAMHMHQVVDKLVELEGEGAAGLPDAAELARIPRYATFLAD